MEINFKIKLSENLYLKDPESSEIGRTIIKESIQLIYKIGYEQFTFKKLAQEVNSVEATIYRYFENKHKLLIYLIDLYWSLVEFQLVFSINNIKNPEEKIKKAISILIHENTISTSNIDFDFSLLYHIAIYEGSKTYLSKDVDERNSELVYKPFKDLCGRLSSIFQEYNPLYKYPNSLASSIIEVAHSQYHFMHHLPRLSDFSKRKNPKELESFLLQVVLKALS